MTGPCQINDKTNFVQSLMHMVKGNLGTGILAMPASFSHTGLISAIAGLPLLCVIATYCVHLIIKSTILLEKRRQVTKDTLSYALLAKEAFKSGPRWMQTSAGAASFIVNAILLIAQFGVCCVYIVFVVDNIISILSTYNIKISKTFIYISVFPVALSLSCIRTLKRLAIASACANFLQAVGIACILEYLMRDLGQLDLSKRDNFRPLDEVALGFGSAMFAFEGISVVLPIYLRMRDQTQMSGFLGLINVSYGILLILYFCVGLFGFLRFGHDTKDSITLNLPPEPIYDIVRAMFACSVLLTYPLQFYVPNEIVWTWARRTLLMVDPTETVTTTVIDIQATPDIEGDLERTKTADININTKAETETPKITNQLNRAHSETSEIQDKSIKAINSQQYNNNNNNNNNDGNKSLSLSQIFDSKLTKQTATSGSKRHLNLISCESDTIVIDGAKPRPLKDSDLVAQDYFCRIVLVSLTFILAISVPKLNLLMDFIGSVTGTSLSLIIPCLIHIGAFWNNTSGFDRLTLCALDITIMIIGFVAGLSGSVFSFSNIIHSFNE